MGTLIRLHFTTLYPRILGRRPDPIRVRVRVRLRVRVRVRFRVTVRPLPAYPWKAP